jgi:N-acetylmuramoyl-L-alanine amidase
LRSLGFDLGTDGVDGYFGDDTGKAVLLFQQRSGLAADGVVADNTWCELVESGYGAGERLLYLKIPPFRGADVLTLQQSLNCLGFNAGPEDGIFGSMTENAVLDFQKNGGLVMDGMVDESVLKLIAKVTKDEELHMEEAKIPDRNGGSSGGKALSDCTLVIDAGHGGEDAGAANERGIKEKDINLAIAVFLGRSLEAAGARVVLTRESDQSVPLYIRPATANTAQADLFLSIHQNESENARAQGAVAYYFSRKGYFSEAGKLLAEDIANGIAEAIGIPALPAMGRNFAVLRETEMTAILVEPAFITGEGMTEMVGSEDFARDVAEAIFTALSQYFAVKGSNKPQ